jgi:hypothetical protein
MTRYIVIVELRHGGDTCWKEKYFECKQPLTRRQLNAEMRRQWQQYPEARSISIDTV